MYILNNSSPGGPIFHFARDVPLCDALVKYVTIGTNDAKC